MNNLIKLRETDPNFSRWTILVSVVFVFILTGIVPLPGQTEAPRHNALSYDVDVSAQIIPIYALDKKGNPVFDLKKDDIELYINGEKKSLLFFMNYQLEEPIPVKEPESRIPLSERNVFEPGTPPGPGKLVKKNDEKTPERIVIIILDGISNSSSGVRNAKRLAKNIIKSGSSGDAFVIFISTLKKGLHYITGPDKDKNRLYNKLDGLFQDPKWMVLIPRKYFSFGETPDETDTAYWAYMSGLSYKEQLLVQDQYRQSLTNFSRSLTQLKNALKSIRLPKHIFLVSGGIQEMAIVDQSITASPGVSKKANNNSLLGYYRMLARAAAAINQGGSLLFLINPVPETHINRQAVHIMSQIGNAKCISGKNVVEMMEKVKKSTAAYYEIAFSVNAKTAEKFKVNIKCKRKDIRLNTLKYGEKSRTYAQMKIPLKKVFAMNVVMGGSWARMIAKISIAKAKNSPETDPNKEKNPTIKKVYVTIPENFYGKMVDLFILNIEPKTLKADITMSKRLVTKTETIEIPLQKNRKQYFVMIEPASTNCIVNRVL